MKSKKNLSGTQRLYNSQFSHVDFKVEYVIKQLKHVTSFIFHTDLYQAE